MPRPGQPPASTLRNRNRINNKSRLKIVHGNIDSDPIIPDEDEEKNRLLQSVAGVDQEDANEHHLQAVLSEAALRNHTAGRSTRGAEKEKNSSSTAFIPIPDHTGVADDYEQIYPSNRWKDPISYVQSTDTVEESCAAGLANGFSYYMDERDAEWLERNNEEARGEGTSIQGAILAPGTRVSARSAKAKGKEPEGTQSVVISEDEFELVMGLYEKMTHEKTEFLHHSLATGMAFPTFSEYQDVFSSPLSVATFATYTAPKWLPPPSQLLRIARAIYPYWKERRLERGGHSIIPVLNFDESDTLNESYVCFRRRDVKAVRKTRASQVTSSDKLARLKSEFSFPLELAKQILFREHVKRDAARQSSIIWSQRVSLVDLKCQNPTLSDKLDEELLIDKERPVKKHELPRINGVRVPPKHDPASQAASVRPDAMRPKERCALIHTKVDTLLSKQKELDQHWEDHVDPGYVSPMVAYSSRLFKYVTPSQAPSWPAQRAELDESEGTNSGDVASLQRRSIRVRHGRGGRMFIDRRLSASSRGVPTRHRRRPAAVETDIEDDSMDVDVEQEDQEANLQLAERWRFDPDDLPAYGPGGSDEHDRMLVDDYDLKYLRHTVSLLNDPDVGSLLNDPTITRITPDGRKENIIPFKLGMVPPMARMPPGAGRYPIPNMQPQQQTQAQLLQHQQAAIMISQAGQQNAAAVQHTGAAGIPLTMPHTAVNGTPISVSQQLKMQPSAITVNHMRISANGRAAALPQTQLSSGLQQSAQPVGVAAPQASPPLRPSSSLAHVQPAVNGSVVNGIHRPAMSMPHTESIKSLDASISGVSFSIPNAASSSPTHLQTSGTANEPQPHAHDVSINGVHNAQGHYIARPKSQQGQQSPSHLHQQAIHMSVPATNGHPGQHLSPVNANGYSALPNANASPTSLNANISHPQSTNQTASALSQQQMQNLKSVFNAANSAPSAYLPLSGNVAHNISMSGVGSTNGGYNMQNMVNLQNMQMGSMGSPMNMNLKLPPARQMQWSAGAVGSGTSPPHQRPGSVVNGIVSGTSMSSSPNMRNLALPAQHIPVRTPSANGSRAGVRSTMPNSQVMNGQMHQLQQMSPHMQHASSMQQHHSPSPIPSIAHPHSQSPPRLSQSSPMAMSGSPMMQHQHPQQQPVGNTPGY